jgi:hypothetical protein
VSSDKSLPWKRHLTYARARAQIHMQRVGYRMDHPGFESQQGQRILSSPKYPNRLWGHPASYSMGTETFGCGKSAGSLRPTTHFYRAPRLIISGAVHPLPLYAAIPCIGTTFIVYTYTHTHIHRSPLVKPKTETDIPTKLRCSHSTSVSPDKCLNSTSDRPRPLPSKFFPIHH